MNREVFEELAAEMLDRVEHEADSRADQKLAIKLIMSELKRGLANLDTIDDEDDGDDEDAFGSLEEEPN